MIDITSKISSLGGAAGSNGITASENSIFSNIGNAASAAASAAAGPSFASVLGDIATNAMNTVKAGEAASFAGIRGDASTREVVDAVLQADQTLKTAVALRDRLVSAYLDITKMQI